jgi:hypothetical protein
VLKNKTSCIPVPLLHKLHATETQQNLPLQLNRFNDKERAKHIASTIMPVIFDICSLQTHVIFV